MDKHYNLNKEEKRALKNLLIEFIDKDKSVNIRQTFNNMKKDLEDALKELFLTKFNIKGEVLEFLDKHFINRMGVYYNTLPSSKNSKDIWKISNDFPLHLSNITSVEINTYSWELRNTFIDIYKQDIGEIFEKIYAKYYEDLLNRYQNFTNIYNTTMDIINSFTKATQYLETFGFIDSVNKYLNGIMESVAKNPLTVVTTEKLNAFNNYLDQRKKDVK